MTPTDPAHPHADLASALHTARTTAAAAFVHLDPIGAQQAADAATRRLQRGRPTSSIDGRVVSIKDLFDIAGQTTTAGSIALADQAAATEDALAVARLRQAGAVLIGRTQMTEFAFSGVGINPHHGTPANPVMAALDPVPRIPGGSTSGGAVSVATGAAWAALGSDTGGSIRIPAALQGLVGFKNTQRRTPLAGALPLSPSLDTVCAITRSVRDAVDVHGVLAGTPIAPQHRPLTGWHFAVVEPLFLDGLDAEVARAFADSLSALSRAGARITHPPLAPLADLPALQHEGGLPAAESWAWHRELIARRGHQYDPRVATRIRRGATATPASVSALEHLRADWITRMGQALGGVDVVLSPTVPMVAPPIAPMLADDALFFDTNARLLRNPSVVNLLDGCAISLPCQRLGSAPVGLMLWAAGEQDERLLGAALAVEAALESGRHA